jgi:hypothetical protein
VYLFVVALPNGRTTKAICITEGQQTFTCRRLFVRWRLALSGHAAAAAVVHPLAQVGIERVAKFAKFDTSWLGARSGKLKDFKSWGNVLTLSNLANRLLLRAFANRGRNYILHNNLFLPAF